MKDTNTTTSAAGAMQTAMMRRIEARAKAYDDYANADSHAKREALWPIYAAARAEAGTGRRSISPQTQYLS